MTGVRLSPGRRPRLHLTERQVNRLFHATANAAGIRKADEEAGCYADYCSRL
jgi:hypothetical protein